MSTKRSADVELAVDVRCKLGESPIWIPELQQLIWVDIRNGDFYKWVRGRDDVERTFVGHSVSAVAPRSAGGYVLATRSGFAMLDDNGAFDMIAEVEGDNSSNRMNDGKCDVRGRFWAGTMSEQSTPGVGSLYTLNLDRSVTKRLAGVTISNGIDWSPDGKTMYYVDSLSHGLDAFDYNEERGELGGRQRVIDVEPSAGLADGITVDEEGFIWVALHSGGAVHRYSPEGILDLRVELPVPLVTSCTFGGPNLSELYITTAVDEDNVAPLAGAVFRYQARVAGLPCRRYGN